MIISFHPPITGNNMNSWDLIQILSEKYHHTVINHYDPCFLNDSRPPFATISEAGYQYYLEIVNKGLPEKMMVLGNCWGCLTGWESVRFFKKAGVNTLFCGITPPKWIYTEPRDSNWAERYPSPLKEIIINYTKATESYEPSKALNLKPLFVTSENTRIPNEWTGLCPNAKTIAIKGLPHSLTKQRFGGMAHITASLIDEFIRMN